jgi:hypothetical protein
MPTVDDYLGFLPAYQAGLQDYHTRQNEARQREQLGLEKERNASLEEERQARAAQEQERADLVKQQASRVAGQLAEQEQYKSALKTQVDLNVQQGIPLEQAGPLAFRQTLHLLPAHMLPNTVGAELNRQALNDRFSQGITSKEKIAGEANTVKTDIAAGRTDSAEAIAAAKAASAEKINADKAAAAMEREKVKTDRAGYLQTLKNQAAVVDKNGRKISEQEYVNRHTEGYMKHNGGTIQEVTKALRDNYQVNWPDKQTTSAPVIGAEAKTKADQIRSDFKAGKLSREDARTQLKQLGIQ